MGPVTELSFYAIAIAIALKVGTKTADIFALTCVIWAVGGAFSNLAPRKATRHYISGISNDGANALAALRGSDMPGLFGERTPLELFNLSDGAKKAK